MVVKPIIRYLVKAELIIKETKTYDRQNDNG